ncbi:MAG: type II toxin-antitoxin system HipA family toxin [Lachnospiraceae bacterium]|nr:type II toxin-antitoxin system HipA family toxin [Lachnospiraceae bacterium]
MRIYDVHAGWMEPAEKIGEIFIENTRGKEIISFSYNESWLINHSDFILDPDIYHVIGRQYVPDGKACFGFLSDSAPDRWGRRLMDRRERIDAKKENRPRRKLLESDYIFGVNDFGRTGALRHYDPIRKIYVSERDILAAPPITELRRLEQASLNMEQSNDPDEEKWFMDLIEPGSSLGGARPKANVIDEKGNIWIAKFPSRNDDYNVGAWEMVMHDLQKLCGISIPDAQLLNISDAGSTFLVRRFDRNEGGRIHFASAMTMLGETDNSTNEIGYTDIAGVIETICVEPKKDLHELWDRMVFNICVSNTDDHLRNHGFLYHNGGWQLSPAYDVNPCPDNDRMSLLIGDDNLKNLDEALRISEYFRYSLESAGTRMNEIHDIILDNWRTLAKKYNISVFEQKRMENAFIV